MPSLPNPRNNVANTTQARANYKTAVTLLDLVDDAQFGTKRSPFNCCVSTVWDMNGKAELFGICEKAASRYELRLNIT